MFLREGFDAVSVEAIARATGISKRTFYARFDGKPGVFAAVLEHLVGGWIAAAPMPDCATLPAALRALAEAILAAALRPEALALHRLLVTAGHQVPDLATMLARGGLQEGMRRIALVLGVQRPGLSEAHLAFLAEQFQFMVLTGPQRRFLGLGMPMDDVAIAAWCDRTVTLFLGGLEAFP